MIPALAFIPKNEVDPSFDLVIDEICSVLDKLSLDQTVSEKNDQLGTYFQKNYIRSEKIGKNERSAIFPIDLRNHFPKASAGLVQSTTAVEVWHLVVTALFQRSYPPVSIFLVKIKSDACNQKFNFLKVSAGTVNKSRKTYCEVYNKFVRPVNQYDPENAISLLTSIAHMTNA